MVRPILAACLLACLLAGCSDADDATATSNRSADAASLPTPAGDASSVTGMPDPRIAPAAPVTPLPPADGAIEPPPAADALLPAEQPQVVEIPPTGGGLPPMPAADEGPGSDEAVAVLRDYYAAINSHDFAAAYRLWRSDRIGSSVEQFAAGFADVAGMSVQLGPPGPVDAGAGQRHIEIPVTVTATQRDGAVQRHRGSYVLQRTVVDGASAEQRSWRIVRADLHRE